MGQPFRLLVTGSRTWHDIAAIEQTLAVILDRHPEGVLLVHGACPRGADAIAAAYAARTPGYQVEAHPADWRRYGRAAGYRRSAEMIALGADGAPHSSAAAAQAAPAQSGWPQSQAYRSGSTHSDQARGPEPPAVVRDSGRRARSADQRRVFTVTRGQPVHGLTSE